MATTINRLGIEMLTTLGMPPVAQVRLAHELGCAGISTGLTGLPPAMFGADAGPPWPAWSLADDPALRRELLAALRDTGVRIALGEGFRVRADGDVADRAGELDLMAELGAERINAVSTEPNLPRGLDQFAVLAEMVTARGMAFTIEFAPPNAVATLADALEVIDHVGPDRARLLIDAMHLFRSGGTVADIRALDPARIGYAQLSDVPAEPAPGGYMAEAMFARRVPGEGALPLAELVAALPAELPIGLEVPDLLALRRDGARDHAGRAVAAARAIGA